MKYLLPILVALSVSAPLPAQRVSGPEPVVVEHYYRINGAVPGNSSGSTS